MSLNTPLKQTPLHTLHCELGARMVPFAGYDMPVQFEGGIIQEHLHTRSQAGLFDVSHMGQIRVQGVNAARELESLMPADIQGLEALRSTYALLTNEKGGVYDDLIVTRLSDASFLLVVNAACKDADFERLASGCSSSEVAYWDERALLALQGPASRQVVARILPEAEQLPFMSGTSVSWQGVELFVTCSGYTGEDGFEISAPASRAEPLARLLLDQPEVASVGLGARDSLRLEAGLCLYGHELSMDITPIEAGLTWAIARSRRPDGACAGGYPGADAISRQMSTGVDRVRVGLKVKGRRPVREGQVIADSQGSPIGGISSGGFGASVEGPVAMGFVTPEYRSVGTVVQVDVRGKWVEAEVAKLPMVPAGYYRG